MPPRFLPLSTGRLLEFLALQLGPFPPVTKEFSVHLEEEGGDRDAEGQDDEADREDIHETGDVTGQTPNVPELVPEPYRGEADDLPVELVYSALIFLLVVV